MSNHLQNQTSPYLLQHADNPVDWYPWGPSALEKAKTENKPILLSIGYAACHWCHVMAHESFEDKQTAQIMNKWFVNIKVDREERPDLDQVYQHAHHILANRPGGWPLTVFLRPENQMPFFAGTYFPKTAQGNMISFTQMMQRVRQWYHDHPEELALQNEQLTQLLKHTAAQEGDPDLPDPAIYESVYQQLKQSFDRRFGGFGQAPKFPNPSNLDFLLTVAHADTAKPDDHLQMAIFTMEKMATSGLFDQIGGGFFRYSVDARWAIPHFEKMLYDNGLLLAIYAKAWAITHNPLFYQTCQAIVDWASQMMQSPQGGYYSSLDADSDGTEGKYYVWESNEVQHLLSPSEWAAAKLYYGFDQTANFEDHFHPYIAMDTNSLAQRLKQPVSLIEQQLTTAQQKLLTAQKKRLRPACDDKILTAWNALMIKGLLIASRHCQQPDWLDKADQALAFIYKNVWRDKHLFAAYDEKTGTAYLDAYLDDYAYLLDAVVEFLQCRWSTKYFHFATDLARILLAQFADNTQGGFYFTAHDHETLIQRPKPYIDQATPSGNAVAAYALQRLSLLTGNQAYAKTAKQCLHARIIKQQPGACIAMLLALREHQHPPTQVGIYGETTAIAKWQQQLDQYYLPGQMIFYFDQLAQTALPDLLNRPATQTIQAYVCQNQSCLPPIEQLSELIKQLGISEQPHPNQSHNT